MKLNQMVVMFDYYKHEAQTITRLLKRDIAIDLVNTTWCDQLHMTALVSVLQLSK
jgi:hypothetical protein